MDCTKYNINVETLLLYLVPPFWIVTYETGLSKDVWLAYLKSLSSAYEEFQQKMFNNCVELRDFTLQTGQHLSLEEYLNDIYDPISRRIYITENNRPAAGQTFYNYGETDPENKVYYEEGEGDPAPKIWYTEAEVGEPDHFTINIPSSITFTESVLRGEVDPYVVNAYNYNILTF